MNPTQLIVVLFVATATASAQMAWVFFAKVKDKYEPLSGRYLGDRFGNVSMFTYGDPSAQPVEFSYEDKQAYTLNASERQSVGFYGDEMVFGPRVPSARLKLDQNWMVHGGPFYSCESADGRAHAIRHVVDVVSIHYCFEVQIYFSPYDRETKTVKFPISPSRMDGTIPEEDELPSRGFKGPCVYNYSGKHAHEDLEEFLSHYDGECDIYINDQLVYKKGVSV